MQSVSRVGHDQHRGQRDASQGGRGQHRGQRDETQTGPTVCWIRHGGNQKVPPEAICDPSSADAISRVGRAGRSALKGVRGQVVAPYCAFKSSVVDVAGSRDQFARAVPVSGKFVFVGVIVSRVFQRVQGLAGDGGLGCIRVV